MRNELTIRLTEFRFIWNTRWFTVQTRAHAHQHGWTVYHFVSWHPLTRQQNRKDRDA